MRICRVIWCSLWVKCYGCPDSFTLTSCLSYPMCPNTLRPLRAGLVYPQQKCNDYPVFYQLINGQFVFVYFSYTLGTTYSFIGEIINSTNILIT